MAQKKGILKKAAKKALPVGVGRPRVGRPRKPRKTTVPWKRVLEAAKAGAQENEIVSAMGLEPMLADQTLLTRFRDELARGHASYRLQLRTAIKRRGLRSWERSGSVNALALQARNILEWDKQIPTQEMEPDLGTARQRLRDLLVKLAEARTKIEGRRVTPLALLYHEAHQQPETSADDA